PSGSVSDSQLSSNVALLNRNSQTFTGNNQLFKNNTNSTTGFQVQNAAGASVLTVDTTNSTTILQSINSEATLGSEKVTNGTFTGNATGWTLGTGWAYNSNNATKTAGTASDIEQNISASAGETYRVAFTISNRTAGCLTPEVGGVSGQNICANSTTQTQVITATTTGNLKLKADSAFDGTIDNVSVMKLTASNSVLTVKNSDASTGLEIRSGGTPGLNNTFIGLRAGQSTTEGDNNTALGVSALRNLTSGIWNVAIGSNALQNTTTGFWNVAVGGDALASNTTGAYNTAIGTNAMWRNTTGVNNTALGEDALIFNTTGNNNTAIGSDALDSNTTGEYNTAIGSDALDSNTTGEYNAAVGLGALGSNTTGNNNTALGPEAGATNVTGSANVFLGYQAGYSETGSNKLYIENSSTSTPLIGGDFAANSLTFNGFVLAKNTADSTTAFQVQNAAGNSLFTVDTSGLKITLGAASATPVLLVLGTKNTAGDPTCTSGAVYYNSSTKQGKVCVDGAWSAVSAPVVTTLPSSPSDGDEVTYQADATNGIYWHLRYRAGSASAYKWEFLGGSELYSSVATAESTQSATFVALATAGPSIALPLPGDYEIGLGATISQDSANSPAVMSFDIGATAASDGDSIWEFYSVRTDGTPGPIRNANVLLRKTGLSAVTLTAKYHSTSNANSTFSQRTMRARPIRVGP
ncbi:MAG TPA: hypothetical protein VNA68_02170, partial [Candidatus Dormibacteraeota bacterium]|nr:hypothetical protein [Candidatus Dormibacteraeota bacterium]